MCESLQPRKEGNCLKVCVNVCVPNHFIHKKKYGNSKQILVFVNICVILYYYSLLFSAGGYDNILLTNSIIEIWERQTPSRKILIGERRVNLRIHISVEVNCIAIVEQLAS